VTVSIHTLRPGVVYVVVKPFQDYHGDRFEPGARLTFVGRSFMPYHGGHTLTFRERTMWLQETDDRDLIDAFDQHLAVHDDSAAEPLPEIPSRGKEKEDDVWTFVGSAALAAGGAWMFVDNWKRGGVNLWAGAAATVFFLTVTVVAGWARIRGR
jgi:hypothetical protein